MVIIIFLLNFLFLIKKKKEKEKKNNCVLQLQMNLFCTWKKIESILLENLEINNKKSTKQSLLILNTELSPLFNAIKHQIST